MKLVLLVSYLTLLDPSKELLCLELYAGTARLTRLAKSMGLSAEGHDIAFDEEWKTKGGQSAFDITKCSGYLLLVHKVRFFRLFRQFPENKIGFIDCRSLCYTWFLITGSEVSDQSGVGVPLRKAAVFGGTIVFLYGGSECWYKQKRLSHSNGGSDRAQRMLFKFSRDKARISKHFETS